MRQHFNTPMTALALVLAFGMTANTAVAKEDKKKKEQRPFVEIDKNPYPSTYKTFAAAPVKITNVTIFDGIGGKIENGSILFANGKIVAVGKDVKAPQGATVIDGTGKFVTPGIIDNHSHLGDYATPAVNAHSDGNEATSPNTAEVWAEHSVWPHDPGFARALAGGVTALQVLPGSANLIGGRGVTLKNVYSRTMQGMKFPDAPNGLKMACGENPKRVYGGKGRLPSTRMGNVAGYRAAWSKAVEYKRSWDEYKSKYNAGEDPNPPKRDLQMDTLMGVLDGEILIHNHCYRADEEVVMIDIAKEFGYKIGTFHHAIESYKVADVLAKEGICSSMWADWGMFKMEAYDTIRENIPMVHKAGACAIVHSDSAEGIQRLNQEAAKALAHGRKAGIDISKEEAWAWLSLNPAKSLGIDKVTGSLEVGKNADVVLWSGDPFSVYTKAEQVYVDGAKMFDLNDSNDQPVADFRLGHPGEGDAK